MTTTTAVPVRRAHSVPTHPAVRQHRGQVARWALANGHLVERDALAAIVAVRADPSSGAVDLRWTAQDVGARDVVRGAAVVLVAPGAAHRPTWPRRWPPTCGTCPPTASSARGSDTDRRTAPGGRRPPTRASSAAALATRRRHAPRRCCPSAELAPGAVSAGRRSRASRPAGRSSPSSATRGPCRAP